MKLKILFFIFFLNCNGSTVDMTTIKIEGVTDTVTRICSGAVLGTRSSGYFSLVLELTRRYQ